MKNSNIVTVGGGTGGSIIDEALCKEFPNLTAIVTSFDNGGSSGILRREFGMLPQGDIRRRIFAQKTVKNKILAEIYNFRFMEGGRRESFLESHAVGNLLILAATKIWGEKKGIEKICELWGIKGKVLPVTYDYAELAAKLQNGKRVLGEDIIGQTVIDKRDLTDDRKIEKVYLTRATKINPDAKKAIEKADYIILCPGDFYTSLIPNFLVNGFCESIKKAKKRGAKIVFVTNIMTKFSETNNFKLSNFLLEVEKYLGCSVDYILYNKTQIDKKILDKYKKQELAVPVENDLLNQDIRIREIHMLKQNSNKNNKTKNNKTNSIRHDIKLFLKEFKKIVSKKKEKQKEKIFVFDLDDTLIHTSKFDHEYHVKNFSNLKFFPEALKVLQKLGITRCILLTYDKHGLQDSKTKHLNTEKLFSKNFIVKTKIEKREVLYKLKNENLKSKNPKEIFVVGDRHDDGELAHALELDLRTICVALPGGFHLNKNNHPKYDLVIDNEKDFSKILELV